MKKVLLLASGSLVVLALTTSLISIFGISSSGENIEFAARLMSAAGVLTLASIGLFFVGLGYPATVVENTTYTQTNLPSGVANSTTTSRVS